MFAAALAEPLQADMLEAAPYQPEWLDVSRETLVKLEKYLQLVTKWNDTINLISARSAPQGWTRHVLDSVQLWPLSPVKDGIWLDIGSGGGFPGMVISILAQESAPDLRVVLVESDRRKSVFLNEAARQLGVPTTVYCARVEALPPICANVISARALAPLNELLAMATRHLSPTGVVLFPKGSSHPAELEYCRKRWAFESETVPSRIDPAGVILKISALRHA